jgi:hypothetical protein
MRFTHLGTPKAKDRNGSIPFLACQTRRPTVALCSSESAGREGFM